MLQADNACLVIVDVQDKLAHGMADKDTFLQNLSTLIRGAQVLEIPIVLTEQYPEGLGYTIPEIKELVTGVEPISKRSFSCCGNDTFLQQLRDLNRSQILIAGIETHVCVYQTSIGLTEVGYHVEVVADAVASRKRQDKEIALERLPTEGVKPATTEMVLFDLLERGEGDKFKQILKLVK